VNVRDNQLCVWEDEGDVGLILKACQKDLILLAKHVMRSSLISL